jgi:serine/threonine protein kinase
MGKNGLSKRGKHSKASAKELKEVAKSRDISVDTEALEVLSTAASDWSDTETAEVLDAAKKRISQGRNLDADDLRTWLTGGGAEAAQLSDLLSLFPPAEIRILGRKSQVGSQKIVYDAEWKGSERSVVAKRFLDEDTSAQLLKRELQPHPLSMVHSHIIETHILKNDSNEPFLVEKKLAVVLDDDWKASGVAEAAGLLHDIASALHYLHDGRGLVHGDVKPDNLGFDELGYVLLDFGVCRRAEEFADGGSATGSIRTRAPELLLATKTHSYSSDIWALGATVFSGLVDAFPLFDVDEEVPRVSDPERRKEKEEELKSRASGSYKARVFDRLGEAVEHEGLRLVLEQVLAPDPDIRPSAGELVGLCRRELKAFIASEDRSADISSSELLEQLDSHLPAGRLKEVMPMRRYLRLLKMLESLGEADLDAGQQETLAALKQRTGE